jgi:pyruvate/2-oxoglutarate dehydrogenase complex dihydrolipoamide dehydrogenase (E3) component
MTREPYEILIFGGGRGGTLLAWDMAQSGRRTAVVERQWIGGSCPNVNCLPSKNEIASAKVAASLHLAASYGAIANTFTVDMAKVRRRKREMVARLNADYLAQYKATGAELIMGAGRFVGPKTIEVQLNGGGTRLLEGDRVFINVGTRASIAPIPGLAESKPLTSLEALELDYVPEHLIVFGGSYVGLELAQAFRRFGSRVTIVERAAQLVEREDPDVAEQMREILTAEGIDVLLGVQTLRVEGRSRDRVEVFARTSSGDRTIAGSDILAATGRTPNTTGIGLDIAGVALDDRGFVRVNERLETTAPEIWAIGDCAGSPQFTHVSFDDAKIIRDNLLGGRRTTRNRLIPYCMFTDPPLARVGMDEREAARDGIEIRLATLPISAIARARTTGEEQGMMKALVSAKNDRILGFTMIGADAGEVVATVQLAILAGLPYTQLRDAILAHPTMAEGLWHLFAGVGQSSAAPVT